MKNYGLYIFDFDGTMFDTRDSMPLIFKKSLAAINREISDDLAKDLMHHSLVDSFKALNIADPEEQMKVYLAVIEALDSPDVLALTHPFPETEMVLDSLLTEGKKIAIVSSNTADHIRLSLKTHNMSRWGKVVVGSEIGKKTKPNPDPLWECLELCDWKDKDSAVYIGDSLQDMVCAKSAGIDGILVERNGEYPDYRGEKIDTLLELL